MRSTLPRSAAILSLTGGGIMARFTTEVLEGVQAWRDQAVGAQSQKRNINYAFDVLAGTSAGALCVAGLVLGRTPSELSALLDEHGPLIFPKRKLGKVRWFLTTKYRQEPLVEAIDVAMNGEDPELGELEDVVAFPAIDETLGLPIIFNSRLEGHKRIKLRDAVLASASAPTYFPAHRIPTTGHRYVDGGLFANAPDLAALTILKNCWPHLTFEDVHVISVGTTHNSHGSPYRPGHAGAKGVIAWAARPPARILNLAMRGQVDHAMELLPQLSLADFVRIDAELANAEGEELELDNASEIARSALKKAAKDALVALDATRVARTQIIVGRNRWS